VLAVPKPAVRRDGADVGEGLVDGIRVGPQPDRADAGGVDDHSAAVEHVQLPRGGGVPSLRVAAHGTRVRLVAAEERVRECGLARARLAEQHRGAAGEDIAERVDPDALERGRHRDHDARMLRRHPVEVRRVRRCRLAEHDHRHGARIGGEGDAAVEAARLHGPVEPAGDEHDVDVRRERLVSGPRVGVVATQQRLPREHRDGVPAGRLECEPVADGRLGALAGGSANAERAVTRRDPSVAPS